MAEPLRILSIGAHPADIFDQSGGTMAHHASRGDYVGCVVLTHGARVHDAVISDAMFHREAVPEGPELLALMKERSNVKADEVRAACKILGVDDIYFFGADDAVLLVTEDTVKRLARLLRELRPDIVLTHFPKEGDGLTNAHATTGQIVMHAISFAGSVDAGDRNPPHRIARVFFFGTGAASTPRNVWDSEGGYYNDVFIDITDVADKKLAALDCLVSQGYGGAYARKRIETSDGAFGSAGGCAYAEGFISLNAETHYYLPLTDHALKVARSSDHENITRTSYRIQTD
ncbi:MAG: PIG-L family deacetylase [Candidatus Poribacteria bacterium]|nr:PIG-L family deacetylase [Candidatus Poribacteria bacterium]